MPFKGRPVSAILLALGKVPMLGLYLYFYRFMHMNLDFYLGIGLADVRLPMALLFLVSMATLAFLWFYWRNPQKKWWRLFLLGKGLEITAWLYLWPLMSEHLTRVLPAMESGAFAPTLLAFLMAANVFGPLWLYLHYKYAVAPHR